MCLHAGYTPDNSTDYGLGGGASRGVPLYRTAPFQFKSTEHAANLFALSELGNIYGRLMNPTTHVLGRSRRQINCGFVTLSSSWPPSWK